MEPWEKALLVIALLPVAGLLLLAVLAFVLRDAKANDANLTHLESVRFNDVPMDAIPELRDLSADEYERLWHLITEHDEEEHRDR